MSAPAFTPGPWEVVKHTCAPDAKLDAKDDWTVRAADGLGICFEGQENPNADADARLIAAAPELYEALESAREWLAGFIANAGRNADEELAQADAALAKARGQ